MINAFMLTPGRIDQYPEVGKWLWDWKHKALWRAMKRVAGPISPDRFVVLLLDELEAREPERWPDIWNSTMHAVEARVERVRDGEDFGSFGYWFARLEQFDEARRLVSQAQQVASRAWRGDVQGAKAALAKRNDVPERVPVSIADSILEF